MKIDKRKKQLTDDEKHYCLRCGKEISEEEYVEYDGFCEECYWLEEDELDEDFLF
ncbi:MAG: hypothetical protein QXX08_06410 [Candidatus Bathyarchaeia archaeon]